MGFNRRSLWIAVSVLTACGIGSILVWAAGGSPGEVGAVPPPELPAGAVPEVDTAVFAVG